MIEISHVDKWYGDFQALKDCTTRVAKGEVVVVCGPSGSGKSTLIKCVNALEPIQQGQIILDGIKVNDPTTDLPKLRARDPDALQYAIARSCQNKADVVAADERESGVRAHLNLGHTFGHAIETGMGYGNWLHGEAVGAGMVMAADASRRMGWLSEADVARTRALIRAAGLPDVAPDLGAETYLEFMGHDKKVESGKMRFVLLKSLGEAVVTGDVPEPTLRATLATCVNPQ